MPQRQQRAARLIVPKPLNVPTTVYEAEDEPEENTSNSVRSSATAAAASVIEKARRAGTVLGKSTLSSALEAAQSNYASPEAANRRALAAAPIRTPANPRPSGPFSILPNNNNGFGGGTPLGIIPKKSTRKATFAELSKKSNTMRRFVNPMYVKKGQGDGANKKYINRRKTHKLSKRAQ
jgi:hypothetical protein